MTAVHGFDCTTTLNPGSSWVFVVVVVAQHLNILYYNFI